MARDLRVRVGSRTIALANFPSLPGLYFSIVLVSILFSPFNGSFLNGHVWLYIDIWVANTDKLNAKKSGTVVANTDK